jgi:AraC-like DNA-binding protein
MEHAKQLMAEMPRSMLDVALEVGFHTQAHFTTVFKRLTGKTPSQWRVDTLRAQHVYAPSRSCESEKSAVQRKRPRQPSA